MIYFKCKNCGALIKVSEKFAGKKGKCARCGATNDIPLQSEKEALPKSLEQPAPAGAGAAPAALAPQAGQGQAQEPPAAPAPRPPRRPGELPLVAQQIDDLVNHLRRRGGAGLFPVVEQAAYLGGAYAVLGLAPLMLLIGLASLLLGRVSYDWSRGDMIEMFLTLVVAALLLPLCQYVIAKIRTAAVKIVQSSPSSVSSTNLLDCIAVMLLVGGVVCLAGGAWLGYQTGLWTQGMLAGLAGLVAAACCLLLAGLALNPQVLNVHIMPQASAGSEAVGVLSFLWKMILRFAPVLLVVLIVYSLAELGWAGFTAVKAKSVRILGDAATDVCKDLIVFTVAYVGTYMSFLMYHLMVDLMRALFEIAANTRPQEHLEPVEEDAETRGHGDAETEAP